MAVDNSSTRSGNAAVKVLERSIDFNSAAKSLASVFAPAAWRKESGGVTSLDTDRPV